MRPGVHEEMVAQHADEAGFLWDQRDRALSGSGHAVAEIARLERRLETHLAGLTLAGPRGWALSQELLPPQRAASVFCLTVLALRAQSPRAVETLREQVQGDLPLARGLISAFAWEGWESAGPFILPLLDASTPALQRLGVAAAAAARTHEGARQALAAHPFMTHANEPLRARALRAVGELGHHAHAQWLSEGAADTEEACRFWSFWSQTLLGQPRAAESLLQHVEGPWAEQVAELAPRALSPSQASEWIRELTRQQDKVRVALLAVRALGDPSWIPFLFEQMPNPLYARLAGEAFSSLTGADLGALDLDDAEPDEEALDDPEDPSVALDADEGLSWPSLPRIEAWWSQQARRFQPGQRYLAGEPVSSALITRVLNQGRQGQRRGAALEQSLRRENAYLFASQERVTAPWNKAALQTKHP